MIRYEQESPEDEVTAAEVESHVRAHLSSVAAAAADDDPETNADDVRVYRTRLPEKPGTLLIVGELDAEPQADYLRDDYDALSNIDPALLAAAGL